MGEGGGTSWGGLDKRGYRDGEQEMLHWKGDSSRSYRLG